MSTHRCPICKKGVLKAKGKRADGFYFFECRNCGLEFFSRRKFYRREKCQICGYNKHPFALDRHHRKDGSIVVLCGNCHNIITRTGQYWKYALNIEKWRKMMNAVIKTLYPIDQQLLRNLIQEELEKYKTARVPEFPEESK